jgi:ribokinase
MKKLDIVSFGSGLVDIFVYTDVHDDGKKISYPIGTKIQIKDLEFDIGGGGINTATTFSRFGLKTGLVCNAGGDEMGKKIIDKIKKEGIVFLGEKKGRTGYSVVLDSKEHDRTILTFKGANDLISLRGVNAEWVYLSSLAGKSFKSQIQLAKSKKYNVAFNPSAYIIKKENIRKILSYVKILILNKEESELVGGKIAKWGPEIVIVTDGANPFFCYAKNKKYQIFPHKDIQVVERTGAGDAFASGFIASFIKTGEIKNSLQIGVANSESVVRHKGSTNVILSWKKAISEIKKNPCEIKEI